MNNKASRPRLRPFGSPTAALLWEQFRLFIPFIGGAIFTEAAAAAGLYINVLQNSVSMRDALSGASVVPRLCSVLLPALLCVTPHSGIAFPGRLYRLPVATRRMVLYVAVPRLLFLLVTLLSLFGFRTLFFGMPQADEVLRMTVLAVLALLAGLALSWSLGAFKNWPALLAQMVVIGMAWSLYDILGKPEVRDALGPDILWPAAGLWAVFWTLILFAGPERARSGVSLLRRVAAWFRPAARRAASHGPVRLRRFSSPLEAQLWYERRTRGYAGLLYPLLFVLFAVMAAAETRLLVWISFASAFSVTVIVAALAGAACFVVAACRAGMEAYRVRAGQFRFVAARPLSTADMARARFHAMWRGAGTAVLFALALAVLLWLLPPLPLLLTPSIWPVWLADVYRALDRTAALWLFVWGTLLWLCASLTVFSTPKILGILFAWPVMQLAATYNPVRDVMRAGGNEFLIALTGLCLVGYVAALFVRALRRGLLSPVTVLLCLAVYAALAQCLTPHVMGIVFWDGYPFTQTQYLVWTMEVLGVIALAVAPVAALPLQFDRWRHGEQ